MVVYSRDIEIDGRKQKTGIIAVLLIGDEIGKSGLSRKIQLSGAFLHGINNQQNLFSSDY